MNLFQKRVRELELTHQEIALALNQPRSSVSAWIAGSRRIPGKQETKFAHLLKLPPKEVVRWNRSWDRQISRRERMELARKTAHHQAAKVTRKEIDDAVKQYLAAGGTIKRLKDGPDASRLEKEIDSIGLHR